MKSVFENVRRVMKVLFSRYPDARWKTFIQIVIQVGRPLLLTAVPSIAIAAITEGNIRRYLLLMIGILLALGISETVQNVLDFDLLFCRINSRMLVFMPNLLRRALTMDYARIEPKKYQKKIQDASESLSNNHVGAERLMQETPNLIIKLIGLLTYGMTIFVLDVRIILIMILMCVVDILLRNHAIRFSSENWSENADIHRQMRYIERGAQNVSGGKDVRIYQMQSWFSQIYNRLISKEASLAGKIQLRWFFPTIADQCFIFVRDLLAYFILAARAVSGEISPAMFTFYLGVIANFSEWFYGFSENLSAIHKASREHDFYRALMDEDEKPEPDGQLPTSPGAAFTVEFKNVCFRYEDSDKDTIHNMNLKIKAGEKIAVVGSNGSGKTTLVKLLCGLYHPTSGTIYVDGRDITSLNHTDYQKRLSVLFQDIDPFHFTIKSNVCTGDEEQYSPDWLKESLEKADLWEKVNSLPHKEDTYITQTFHKDGILLSGGETQKLLLARAIYKNGDFLILDEPTSALDPIAESRIYEQYNKLSQNKTAVFISHRLASTKFCERILYLEHGRIAEEGSHEALMAANGKYREIFDIQSHYYKEKGGASDDCQNTETRSFAQ